MNPAAKQFDVVMGVDIHIIQPPGPVPPVPIPHPFIGIVWDPMDFVPKIGATIFVNGIPRAQAGTAAKDLPVHFPIGGMFVKPPGNVGEMFMGSATVLVDGEPFSYMALQALSCHDIGMMPPLRKRKGGAKTMTLPTSVVLPIPMGKQVLVGGPPTISMTGMAIKLGLAGLGKGLKKFRKLQKGSNKMKALSKKLRDAVNKSKLAKRWKDRLKSAICTLTGHPVNVADGSVMTSKIDFELPGPIPFKWERSWFSNYRYDGPIGQGWSHSYDMALEIQDGEIVVARLQEGRLISFPLPEPGQSYFDRKERLTLFNEGGSLYLRDQDRLTYHFKTRKELSPFRNLERIEDANGFTISFEYVNDNALSRVIDSAGRELLFEADDKGRISKIEAPHPNNAGERFVVQSYRYDERGNLIESVDALNNSMKYAYSGTLLTREINRNGFSFYFEYEGTDENARCFHTWGDGGIYNHRLQFFEGLTIVENSLGYKTSYYHEGGLVHKTIDPNGGVSVTGYNDFNELLFEKDPLGFGPAYDYDARGNTVQTIAADGAVTQMTFNETDLPVKAIDPVGGPWQWQYDDKGNLIKRSDPLGNSWVYRYQGGMLIEMVNPAKGNTILAHDENRNLTMLISPDGNASWWSYDRLGRCTESTDPKGNVQQKKFDLLGRVTEVSEPDGNVRKLMYDGEDNVILARDQQHDVRFEFAGMDKMKARIEAGTRVEFQYDKEEQLTAIVNEHRSIYSFVLNANGEVVEELGFDGIRRVYLRDAAGRVTTVQRPGGLQSFYDHDPCGRVLKINHSDGTYESFAYREDGELIEATNAHSTVKLTRDLLGQVIREDQNDEWIASTYDQLGMRTSVTSSMGADFSFLRNNMGDVNEVKAGDFKVSFQRDALGLELEREFSGGLRSRWNRDKLGRPIKQETFTGRGFTQRTRTYQWGVNDRLRQISDSKIGITRFGHDEVGNLAWSENPDGSMLFRMPDAVGNLFRTKERNDRKYGAAGQLLQSGHKNFYYDQEGILIRQTEGGGKEWNYEWEASGMLSQVVRPDGEAVIFTYDALGRRLSKTFRGRTTQWVWDGSTLLHEWTEGSTIYNKTKQTVWQAGINSGSEVKEGVATWLFEPESFAPLAKLVNAQSYGIITDHLGTPLSMHDVGGKTVWAADLNNYGEVITLRSFEEDCPFRYPGQYEDMETGLYYNRFRYYDTKEGMYVSRDPIGLLGGIRMYGYVSDSNELVDVFGLNSCKPKLSQARALSKLGLDKNMRRAFFQGNAASFSFSTSWGGHVDGFIKNNGTHVSSYIFYVKDKSGKASRTFMEFRSKSRNVAKSLGHDKMELGGMAIINPDVESMVNNMAFKKGLMDVPEALGGKSGETVEVFTKMFPIK